MAKARAYTNIALIKYWGKKDTQLTLPYNNSISLTLDQFYTETEVTFFDPQQLAHDQFFFDDQPLPMSTKVQRVLDYVRHQTGSQQNAVVKTRNFVPTTAGLASSASAFAALALAASQAADLACTPKELSIIARHGSGSASRSIFGGFVEWEAGRSDTTSYAKPLMSKVDFPISVIAILINHKQKAISSTQGMQNSVSTSPYYSQWVKSSQKAVTLMKQAIQAKDIPQIGRLAEHNAMMMHATTLSAQPPFTYFAPQTIAVWQEIQAIRRKGLSCYLTLDAGPNPKLICAKHDAAKIVAVLKQKFPKLHYVICHPGPSAQLIS